MKPPNTEDMMMITYFMRTTPITTEITAKEKAKARVFQLAVGEIASYQT